MLKILSFDAAEPLGVGNFSFSIYIFFGRNWWSHNDLGFCLVLIRTVFFKRTSCHDPSLEVFPLLPRA